MLGFHQKIKRGFAYELKTEMARIGKCRKCKKDWVKLVSYGNWKQQCDGIGFCNNCDTEHRLEMRGESHNYSICEDWEVNGEFYSQKQTEASEN